MPSDADPDILNAFEQIAQEHFERDEREAARDLILNALGVLPWELQELYFNYVELYRTGKREQADKLYEMWMDRARELGLI